MTSLTDQTVLVTGANRGIGQEFVRQLLDRDAAKVYAAARDPDAIALTDPRMHPLQLDVTDAGSVTRAAEIACDVGIVVNNAGISLVSPILDDDNSALRQELEVNFFGPLAVTTAFVDGVVERLGAVVNIASVMSWVALGGSYSASKAALWSATDSMRVELAPRGVQVVGVYMGYVDTDMTAGVEAPKTSVEDVVRLVLDGVESGVSEVLVDDAARQVRAGLHLPVRERYEAIVAAIS
ncbi:SDR family oxidoreductase [Aeromicrobium panaciterrae]|uniref:SDR family oxidoreductase n=1 Tax=Aeromicrobium panaciterrae TaxID=363861 RepID=UPI0031E3C761